MGVADGDVRALLERVVDLEVYIPVRAHREAWTGANNAVVAFALRDHEIPTGFTIGGAPYQFTSADVPPDIPVIAVVPIETDFSPVPARQECWEDCGDGGGGGGGPPTYPAGLWMTYSVIPGDDEGFLMGDPEFEIHVAARRTPLDTGGVDVQCAGEHAASSGNQQGYASGNYVYDQNDTYWSGNVMLFSLSQIQATQTIDSSMALWVWEDDNDACKIVKQDVDIERLVKDLVPLVSSGRNAIKVLASQGIWNVLAAATYVLKVLNVFSNFQNDDIVGVILPEASVNQNYSDATHAIVDRNAVVRGRVNLIMR
jgi:hypothetical protein